MYILKWILLSSVVWNIAAFVFCLSPDTSNFDVSIKSMSPYDIMSASISHITTIFAELYWSYVFNNGGYGSEYSESTRTICILL